MLLQFDDEVKAHLELLSNVDPSVVGELGKIAGEFLENGINPRLYSSAAQKLDVEATEVQSMVEGIMQLLNEASRHKSSVEELSESLEALGLSEELHKPLVEQHEARGAHVRQVLGQLTPHPPTYVGLDWRFDVQVASRLLRRQVTPSVVLKLHTKHGEQAEQTVLQVDPVNLRHLTNSLEAALDEMRSNHSRRIARNIK